MPTFQQMLEHEPGALPIAERKEAERRKEERERAQRENPERDLGPPEPAYHDQKCSLAFSGGGIRSATFGLGVLQGLAQAKMLSHIRYLSTVSGGGYIGGWLISWIGRAPGRLAEVEDKLGDYENNRDEDGGPEPKQINFLRDYSNYLTPRKGLFGADTWAAIATYLRNVLLNQVILIAFLGALLLVPWLVGSTISGVGQLLSLYDPDGHIGPWSATIIAAGLLWLAIAWASLQATRCSIPIRTGENTTAGEDWVILAVAFPLFLSASLTLIGLSLWRRSSEQPLWRWAIAGALVYGMAHFIATLLRIRVCATQTECKDTEVHKSSDGPQTAPGQAAKESASSLTVSQKVFIPLTAVAAGGVGGLLLCLSNLLVAWWRSLGTQLGGSWHAIGGGPPLLVVAFLLVGGLHIGLLKLLIAPEEQEWWSRLGGLLLRGIIVWAAIFGLAIFAPYLVVIGADWAKTKLGLTLGWVASTAFGLLSGKSSKTSGKSDGNPALEVAALLAPYIFILGLLTLLSLGAHRIAIWNASAATEKYWDGVREVQPSWALLWIVILGAVAVALAFRVDINIFSMNLLYRNRLVRCYLGASRNDGRRQPNRFTGFDPADDPFLTDFDNNVRPNEPGEKNRDRDYQGPYPIVCAALNVTHGGRLAWQERKAESFVFTPKYCGYDFPEMRYEAESDAVGNRKAPLGGYHDTETYAYPKCDQSALHAKRGGIHLGTAISISGAAASPNMGYHTSPPLAFLMTVFDVRMGWWLPNSRYTNDQLPRGRPEGGPRSSLLYLLQELFASTTDQSKYVYLSDGGHFENLAVYELVRRRSEYIIACDGDADAGMTFGDLGNTIRKCRSDFGVEITIDPTPVKLLGPDGFAKLHGALGEVRYPTGSRGEKSFVGKILYIKPTITEGIPRDVLAYRDSNPGFPDQSTADQWFDESQFESYRRLGLHSFRTLAGIAGDGEIKPITVAQLFESVRLQIPR
jgi:hypothetical protein